MRTNNNPELCFAWKINFIDVILCQKCWYFADNIDGC